MPYLSTSLRNGATRFTFWKRPKSLDRTARNSSRRPGRSGGSMMPSSLDPDSCFHELSLPDGRLIWDDRQQLLAWESPSATAAATRLSTYSAVLSLDSFPHFEKASPDSITN